MLLKRLLVILIVCGVMISSSSAFAQENVSNPPDKDMVTVKVALKYLDPGQAANRLTSYKSDEGEILIDEQANTLILVDTPESVDKLEKKLRTLDVPQEDNVGYQTIKEIAFKIPEAITTNAGKFSFSNSYRLNVSAENSASMQKVWDIIEDRIPKITIEAKMVEVTLNPEFKDGVDWKAIVSNTHRLENGPTDGSTADNKETKLVIGAISPDDYKVLWEALGTIGKTKVLDEKTRIILNNQPVGLWFGTAGSLKPNAGESLALIDNQDIPLGDLKIKLLLQPSIDETRGIRFSINPQINPDEIISDKDPSSENFLSTQALTIRDGMTIIIGGIIKEEETKNVQKLPFFSELPFVGAQFVKENKTTRRIERAIFLTAHLDGEYAVNSLASKNVEAAVP